MTLGRADERQIGIMMLPVSVEVANLAYRVRLLFQAGKSGPWADWATACACMRLAAV
jgi:hypothetical protein